MFTHSNTSYTLMDFYFVGFFFFGKCNRNLKSIEYKLSTLVDTHKAKTRWLDLVQHEKHANRFAMRFDHL